MLSKAEKIEFLMKTKLFRKLPEDMLEDVATIAQEVRFGDGDTVFEAGSSGDAIYFVFSGQVMVHKSGVEMARRGSGECIGEMAVMDESPRSASLSSLGDSMLLRIHRNDFYQAIHGDVELLQNVLRIVVGRFREEIDRTIEATRQNERMMQDLRRARELQVSMLPDGDLEISTSSGLRLTASGVCYPAELVGGDYYDYFPLEDDKVGLVIGDVMGHGFHTGLMVCTAKSCLYNHVKFDSSVSSVMSAMNDTVYGFVHGDLFMSFCYIIVDLGSRKLSFCNAGHPYPHHYHASSGQLDKLESNACLLGVLEHQHFETLHREWELGDLLVLYTDGITEAHNGEGEDFGDDRLSEFVISNSHLPPDQLRKAVFLELSHFCQGTKKMDDTSLVIIKFGA